MRINRNFPGDCYEVNKLCLGLPIPSYVALGREAAAAQMPDAKPARDLADLIFDMEDDVQLDVAASIEDAWMRAFELTRNVEIAGGGNAC